MLPFLVSKQATEETIINRNDGAHFFWQLGPVFPNLVYTFQRGEHITNTYITETDTTKLENLRHNIIDVFIIQTSS